jgi:hypothetical protein
MIKIGKPNPMFVTVCLTMATFCVAFEFQTVVVVKIQKKSQDRLTESKTLRVLLEVYFKSFNDDKELTLEEEMNEKVLESSFNKVEGYNEGSFGEIADGNFRLRSFYNLEKNLVERMLKFDDNSDLGFKYSKKENRSFQNSFNKLEGFTDLFKFSDNNTYMKILVSEKNIEDTQTIIFSFRSDEILLLPILGKETQESLKTAYYKSKSLFFSIEESKNAELNEKYPTYLYLTMVPSFKYYTYRPITVNCQPSNRSFSFEDPPRNAFTVEKNIEFGKFKKENDEFCLNTNLETASLVFGSNLKRRREGNVVCFKCDKNILPINNVHVFRLGKEYTGMTKLMSILEFSEDGTDAIIYTSLKVSAKVDHNFTFRVSLNESKEFKLETILASEYQKTEFTIIHAIELKKEEYKDFKVLADKLENISMETRQNSNIKQELSLQRALNPYFDIYPYTSNLDYHKYNLFIQTEFLQHNIFLSTLKGKFENFVIQNSKDTNYITEFDNKYFSKDTSSQSYKNLYNLLGMSRHLDELARMIEASDSKVEGSNEIKGYIHFMKYAVKIFMLYANIYRDDYHPYLIEKAESAKERFTNYEKEIIKNYPENEFKNEPNGDNLKFVEDMKGIEIKNFFKTLNSFIEKNSAAGRFLANSKNSYSNGVEVYRQIEIICKTLYDETYKGEDSGDKNFLKDFKAFSKLLPTLLESENKMQLLEGVFWKKIASEFANSIDFFCKIFEFQFCKDKDSPTSVKETLSISKRGEVIPFFLGMVSNFFPGKPIFKESDYLEHLTTFNNSYKSQSYFPEFTIPPVLHAGLSLINSFIDSKLDKKGESGDISQLKLFSKGKNLNSPCESPYEKFEKIEDLKKPRRFVNDKKENLFFYECRGDQKMKCRLVSEFKPIYLENVIYIVDGTGIEFIEEISSDKNRLPQPISALQII